MRFLAQISKIWLGPRGPLWLLLPAFLCAGCGREEIRVYEVPKEAPDAATAAHSHGTADQPPRGSPSETLSWTAPDGWQNQGGSGMRVASFSISGTNNQKAEVAVMSLNRMGGSELQLVNLWRSTIGLTPVDESQLTNMVETVPIGTEPGKFFDIAKADAETTAAQKAGLYVAMVTRGETSWFFKLAGDPAVVGEQKETFKAFLKSVTFKAAQPASSPPSQASAGPQPGPGSPAKPAWESPSHWREVPPSAMLVAKFTLTGESGAAAEVTVSVFPGDVGGLLANVNRWRSQVTLAPVEQSALANLAIPLELQGGAQATLVDFTGTKPDNDQPVRLIGAVVPQGGQTWFYKLIGDASLAEKEKAVFLKFIQSARYPNA